MKVFFKLLVMTALILSTTSLSNCFAQQSKEEVVLNNIESVDHFSVSQLENMAIELKYYDEVLTSSVLSYAFSSDIKWLDRYKEYESKLNGLLEKLLLNQQNEDLPLIAKLNEINNVLITLEMRAIAAIQSNDR